MQGLTLWDLLSQEVSGALPGPSLAGPRSVQWVTAAPQPGTGQAFPPSHCRLAVLVLDARVRVLAGPLPSPSCRNAAAGRATHPSLGVLATSPGPGSRGLSAKRCCSLDGAEVARLGGLMPQCPGSPEARPVTRVGSGALSSLPSRCVELSRLPGVAVA